MGQPLPVLFEGYYDDLARLARLVAGDLAAGQGGQASDVGLLEKLALETARLVVDEQCFLLPALRQVVPDGGTLAQREAARLVPLLDAMRRMERLQPPDGALRRELAGFVRALDELAEQRRSVVYPALIAGFDDDTLTVLGDRVAPTVAAGATHSHPMPAGRSAQRYAGRWPRPGFTDDMAAAFAAGVRARQPAIAPVQA